MAAAPPIFKKKLEIIISFEDLNNKMKVAIVLLLFLGLAKSQSYSCPQSEDIKPCTCSIGSGRKPWITCENVKSADELVKAVKNMGSLSVETFNLEKSNIGVLPADAFNGLEIESLNIMDSNLTKLSDDRNRPPFLGLENSLEYLEIRAAFGKNAPLSSLSLSHLKKLTFIQLEQNVIPSIGNNWFESGPYSLKDLHLLTTGLSTLGSHAFEALEHLEYVVINGGYISEVTRNMFPMPAQYLQSIDLSENKLQSLPADMFTRMPSLDQVFLEHNAFSTISEVSFAQVWSQLEYVYLHGNPIKCDSDLRWIYKYRLPEHFDGYCASPAKLLHKSLRNVTLSDLE